MLEHVRVNAKGDAAYVIQRSRSEISRIPVGRSGSGEFGFPPLIGIRFPDGPQASNALRQMQATRASEDHGLALADHNFLVAFLVEVRQLAAKRRMNVFDSQLETIPE